MFLLKLWRTPALLTLCLLLAGSSFFSAAKAEYQPEGRIAFITQEELFRLLHDEEAGKVGVISIFASWCPPCREEFPMLSELRRAYAHKDLFIAGISADESTKDLRHFLGSQEVNFPIYLGTSKLLRHLRVRSIPHLFIFDKKGELRESLVGLPSEEKLKELVRLLMDEGDA